MKRTVRVSTEYGPVDLEITQCDNPGCATCVRTDFLVGWHRLSPLGKEVVAFGSLPDPLDFCSLNCLVAVASRM